MKKYTIEFNNGWWYFGTISCAVFGFVNFLMVGIILATLPIFMIIQAFVIK